ncbi:MAG TPA: MFS transporter, partial [bacterium]|nr:MFS transporter [bacterium]
MPFFQSIYITSFLMSFMNCLISVSLPMLLAESMHSSSFIIGLVGFAGNFLYTIVAFLQPRFSLRKKLILFIYTPAGAGLCYIALPFVSLPLIFGFFLIASYCYAIFWPSMQHCFTGSEGDKKAGIFNLTWPTGLICGAIFAGKAYSLDARIPFIFAVPVAILSLLLLLGQKKNILSMKPVDEKSKANKMPSSAFLVKEVRTLHYIHFMASGAIMFLFPKLALARGFSPSLIGNIFAILLFSRLATFFILRKKPLLLHPYRFFISSFLFCTGSCMIGLGTHPAMVISGTVIIGITGAFSYHNSFLLHLNYGLPVSTHEALVGAGCFTGPLLVGTMGHIFNLPAAFFIMGIIILSAGICFNAFMIFRKRKSL